MLSLHTTPAVSRQKTGTAILALGFLLAPAHAHFFDDFEDGNYTSNPAWVVTNPVGEASVEVDPLDPGNLALRGHGSNTAHHTLLADASLPWNGFHASLEFLATQTLYHPCLGVGDGAGTGFGMFLQYQAPGPVGFRVIERTDTQEIQHMLELDPSEIPINEWLRLSMWHDPSTGLINADICPASGGTVIGELSFLPTIVDLGSIAPISAVAIALEETAWQYLDNVSLIAMLGDLNCDGVVNTFDIDPFVELLTGG